MSKVSEEEQDDDFEIYNNDDADIVNASHS